MIQNFQKAIQELDNEKLYNLLKSKIDLKENQEYCKVNTPENLKTMIILIREEFLQKLKSF